MRLSGQKYQPAPAPAISRTASAPRARASASAHRRALDLEGVQQGGFVAHVFLYVALRASTTGRRAARMEGKKPPSSATAHGPQHRHADHGGRDRQLEETAAEAAVHAVIERPGDARPDQGARDRQRRGLQNHRHRHGKGAIAERPQGGDLAAPRRHRGIHGVEAAEQRADRHDDADAIGDHIEEGGKAIALLLVPFGLQDRVDRQGGIGGQRPLEAIEGAGEASRTSTLL